VCQNILKVTEPRYSMPCLVALCMFWESSLVYQFITWPHWVILTTASISQLKIWVALSLTIQCEVSHIDTPQATSQNRKGEGKSYLTSQAILPHPPWGVHVGLTNGPDWWGCLCLELTFQMVIIWPDLNHKINCIYYIFKLETPNKN